MKGILKALRPTDEVTLVAFGGWPLVPVSWTHVAGLDGFDWAQWVVSPETSLLDAVGASIEMMDLRSGGHGAVLVLSDGLEVSSSISLSSVVRSRRQSETELYAFKFDPAWDAEGRRRFPQWFPRAGVTPPANHYLEQLVGDSGGVVYTISNEDAVAAMVKEFVKTLTGQFLVGYTSTKPLDGKYRRIKIEPTRRDLKLRHRGGYLAVPLAQ